MTRKVFAGVGSVAILFSFLMTTGFTGKEEVETQIESIATEVEMPQQVCNIKDDIHNAMDIIIGNGSKDLFAGYGIDESFLCWIDAEYGADVIYDIAYEVFQGNQSSDVWYEYTNRSIHVLWLDYCKKYAFSTYKYENVIWQEDTDNVATIDFVGDINFADDWYTMECAKSAGGVENCFSEKIKEELKSADVTLANNEFTFEGKGKAAEGKDYTFKSKKENVKYWNKLGVDIVSLANNHVFDYGEEGLVATIDTLKEENIQISGAGKNINEASLVKYYIAGGRKIGIVSATEIEKFSHFTREATLDKPGVLKTYVPTRVCDIITEAKKECDYVLVNVHWGTEGTIFYDSDQERIATAYVEAGADAVIGGHPHRLQGAGFIDGVPVVYSLGNFWFSTGNMYTTIAQVQIDEKGELKVALLPCRQQDIKVSMIATKPGRDGFYNYLSDCSKNTGFGSNGVMYDLRDKDTEDDDNIVYKSGMSFRLNYSNMDLKGLEMDKIGNLK